MTVPAGHIHVSEREIAHTWPDGQKDDARWEDCLWCSTLEWLHDTVKPDVPMTHAEAEALRAESGEPPTGGSNLSDVARGVEGRYNINLPQVIYGADAIVAALAGGKRAGVVTGSMGAFPAGHRLRRWDPTFAGAHAVFLAYDPASGYWWCDPLAPAGPYVGETVSAAEVRQFVNGLPSGGAVIADLEESMGLQFRVTGNPAGTIASTKADAYIRVSDGGTVPFSSFTARPDATVNILSGTYAGLDGYLLNLPSGIREAAVVLKSAVSFQPDPPADIVHKVTLSVDGVAKSTIDV